MIENPYLAPYLDYLKERTQAQIGRRNYLLNRATKMRDSRNKGYTLKQVGKQFGVSTSCVTDNIKAAFPDFKPKRISFKKRMLLPELPNKIFKGRYKPVRVRESNRSKKCVACEQRYKGFSWNRFLCRGCSKLSSYLVFTPSGVELTTSGKKKLAEIK